ncbi:hypothetical protein AGABI2DRAFT_119062 [Agaricus bisporus var. bisporus H97]|uniref:hypothetical protein n=1 Tax=Agaricus bisporus var. bisporus (strain H97 / ATCC MYA-4626 / FGSC 10389) TaxID=936046 RepID=UPI00029F6472|nr:hypothetical protein AGABI2DRAFT_119062 [Agaricus bisporus var. bisporus H97]EKV46884.1 hypothetical protein AGABI2DRAFT_119062 [Agaricus bisporus var. bisporus H97]
MTSPQPLVCTSLHLPPDLQPFLRIHEISTQVFLPNFDRLRLALEATRDINPEAYKIFAETRKVSRQELQKAFKVLQIAEKVAQLYSKLLKAISEKEPTPDPLYDVYIGTYEGMEYSKEAQEAMNVFRGELESSVRRVTAALNTTDSKISLTSPENIECVSEILGAIDECKILLQRCHDQFAKLSTQTEDKTSIDSNPPSEEETQVMLGKWQTYFDNIRGVWIHGFELASAIYVPPPKSPPGASESPISRHEVPLWRALFQRQDKRDLLRSTDLLRPTTDPITIVVTAPNGSLELQTKAINQVNFTAEKVTSGITASPDATPSNGSASKVPFWRRIFQRMNRNNSNPLC